MLSLDVLHGAADQKAAPNPNDSRQYISVMVALDRATRKPAYLAIHIPPDADQSKGFFIGFMKDEQVNGRWNTKVVPGSVLNLGFDSCDKDSCVARMREGKVADDKGGFIDLLDEFDSADHLALMYTRQGQLIRTSIPLSPYRTAYKKALGELAPQP